MLVHRTLQQLQVKVDTPERAQELGQLGYMQWLGGLPGGSCYRTQAIRALDRAQTFRATDPAVAVFCDLLLTSLQKPLAPLGLSLPKPRRRGGAQERRLSL